MTMKFPVYLDNHSTTKVDPRVVEAMLPFLTEHYGNAASKQHEFGWVAEAAVENARTEVATLIGADAKEIVFTSGATESINLALKGVAEASSSEGNHVITAVTEHKAGLDACRNLERRGFRVTYLPVDRYGMISPDDVVRAITEKTIMVTIMMANNEIGTIAPVSEIGSLCRERRVLFHTDASQSAAKIPVNVSDLNVDLLSFSAHKMYGPKGIGALYVRTAHPRIRMAQQIDGGGHERGLRSGTLNVPAIVGFGKAADIARHQMTQDSERVSALRNALVEGITSRLEETWVNGHATHRLPNNANITFKHVNADQLMMDMKDIAVSSGSACTSASAEPSHVLKAIGLDDENVLSSLRFGLGRFTTAEEIDYATGRIAETVKTAREKSTHYQLIQT
jgi:cysteine desulfurase